MMRMLVVTHNTKLSGAEIALTRVLELVDRDRWEVHVALPDDGPLCARLRELPATEVHVVRASSSLIGLKKQGGGLNLSGWLAAPWHLASLVARLSRLIRQERIDVVLCSSIKADFYAALAAQIARCPSAWYVHDFVAAPFPAWLLTAIAVAGRRLPVLVLANSAGSAEALARLGIPRERLHAVYYPAAAVSAAAPAADVRRELSLDAGARLVTLVGRMTPLKGQREFVEAAGCLTDRYRNVTFLLVGDSLFGHLDNAYRDQVVELLKQPGVAGRVRWLGARADAASIVAQSNVAVMNSLGPEGFGLVAAEAMWAGVPLVGTALGGMADLLVHDETGVVVEPGRVDHLASAIAQLLDDPERGRRLAESARRHVATLQSGDNVRRLELLLERAARREMA